MLAVRLRPLTAADAGDVAAGDELLRAPVVEGVRRAEVEAEQLRAVERDRLPRAHGDGLEVAHARREQRVGRRGGRLVRPRAVVAPPLVVTRPAPVPAR